MHIANVAQLEKELVALEPGRAGPLPLELSPTMD
jgi:hypothetical protein